MREERIQSPIADAPFDPAQINTPGVKPKQHFNSLIFIPIALVISFIITGLLSKLAPDNWGTNFGLFYFLWPFLFVIIIVDLVYIKSRNQISKTSNSKRPIIVEVLGLSCGFLFAFFTIFPIVSLIFPHEIELNNALALPLVIAIYFIYLIYSGFRLSHWIYTKLNKS